MYFFFSLPKSKNLIFVHKRLSIIDIEGGTQPIINAGCVLVANGEIYNDLELRNLLKDFKYKTNSDCETIIAVYKKYGIKGFEKLRGMFSFAIYDKTKKELILSRDSFGIKPLYFLLPKIIPMVNLLNSISISLYKILFIFFFVL